MNMTNATNPALMELTPTQIVAELDKYIVGQHNAKKSVAIAIRNRWRRQQVGRRCATRSCRTTSS